jgi:hypothetical protein
VSSQVVKRALGRYPQCGARHREPYLLHQLVADRTIAQIALQVPRDPEFLASIQLFESPHVAAGEAQHEGFIGITSITRELDVRSLPHSVSGPQAGGAGCATASALCAERAEP